MLYRCPSPHKSHSKYQATLLSPKNTFLLYKSIGHPSIKAKLSFPNGGLYEVFHCITHRNVE